MEFPVLAQIMVSQFKGFRFCLPEVDYGREDIQLTVEYAEIEAEGRVAVTISSDHFSDCGPSAFWAASFHHLASPIYCV